MSSTINDLEHAQELLSHLAPAQVAAEDDADTLHIHAVKDRKDAYR
jgi:hypothetical protein